MSKARTARHTTANHTTANQKPEVARGPLTRSWEDGANKLVYFAVRDRCLMLRQRFLWHPVEDMAIAKLQMDIWDDVCAIFEGPRAKEEAK